MRHYEKMSIQELVAEERRLRAKLDEDVADAKLFYEETVNKYHNSYLNKVVAECDLSGEVYRLRVRYNANIGQIERVIALKKSKLRVGGNRYEAAPCI